ncbi:YggS family pyridoxal phosphate-dependent enzyme [Thermincola potens]|uniref:Pyridoxal phosphate homeostasis protein n=1 Tax=Thermincola potens (strain JR) TaxID=635013 RepID=D5X965_THEPJ|nr:YggS family pyridoxal phosphate-dependent enzyme [Thermincola potens]ADG82969.1 alanine racemase domain protein [Thermincola potens JR]
MLHWLRTNLEQIRRNINEAAYKSGRKPEDIKLIAVSKTVPMETIKAAWEMGVTDFGENRVQELTEKFNELPEAKWHLIGHLQKNKVKYIVDKVVLIHSLDSYPLAEEINKRAVARGKCLDVLIQVNVAREPTKFGLDLSEVDDFINAVKDLPGLAVKGLMTIAPFVGDPEAVRPVFRELKKKFDALKTMEIPSAEMKYLSMGMSNDYRIAIEEGANLVRIGTRIFGERKK